jgi:hypothetical protein
VLRLADLRLAEVVLLAGIMRSDGAQEGASRGGCWPAPRRAGEFRVTRRLPRWRVIENVVAAIERSVVGIPGAVVTANVSIREVITGTPRQVDVLVEVPTGNRVLRVGVEVRDRTSPADLPDVEQLVEKLGKLELDRRCIVSRSGFTADAAEAARMKGIETRTIAAIERPNWWQVSHFTWQTRSLEVLSARVDFADSDDLVRALDVLGGFDATSIVVADEQGVPAPLLGVLQSAMQAELSSAVDVTDGQTITFDLDLRPLADRQWASSKGDLPAPARVVCEVRVHVDVEAVELTAFAGPDGVTAFAGVSATLGRQVTIVAVEGPDGGHRLSVTMDSPKSTPTGPALVDPARPSGPARTRKRARSSTR